MRLNGIELFVIVLELEKRYPLWQADQVEAIVIQDAESRPKEDDFATFHGQKEVLWMM